MAAQGMTGQDAVRTARAGIDPTFDLLDRPIALGGAEDVVLRAAPPETPVLDGRPVEDPRLVAALSVPQELSRAEVLDRVARLGGVLRVLGAEGASVLLVTPEVPEPARTFTVLAGIRIGLEVVEAAQTGAADGDRGPETLTVLPAETRAAADSALRTAVRNVRSHFEGVAVAGGGATRDLDRLMRDSRIEPVAAQLRDPGEPAVTRNGETLSRAQAAEYAASLLDG